jgi:hypothetical protein
MVLRAASDHEVRPWHRTEPSVHLFQCTCRTLPSDRRGLGISRRRAKNVLPALETKESFYATGGFISCTRPLLQGQGRLQRLRS